MDKMSQKFVFGTEESHGYLAGHYARDKGRRGRDADGRAGGSKPPAIAARSSTRLVLAVWVSPGVAVSV
jgi:hypothetical protein